MTSKAGMKDNSYSIINNAATVSHRITLTDPL